MSASDSGRRLTYTLGSSNIRTSKDASCCKKAREAFVCAFRHWELPRFPLRVFRWRVDWSVEVDLKNNVWQHLYSCGNICAGPSYVDSAFGAQRHCIRAVGINDVHVACCCCYRLDRGIVVCSPSPVLRGWSSLTHPHQCLRVSLFSACVCSYHRLHWIQLQ